MYVHKGYFMLSLHEPGIIWSTGLPAQQGKHELIRFCYKSFFMKLCKTSNLDIVRYY